MAVHGPGLDDTIQQQYLDCWRAAGQQTRDGVGLRVLIAADWLLNAAAEHWPDLSEAPEDIRVPLLFLFGSIDDDDPLADDR